MNTLKQTLNEVNKTLSTPPYPNVADTVLVRENLDSFINRLPYKETPIRDRLPRKTGKGLAASWNVLEAIGVGNAPFAEGGTPNEDDNVYNRRSAVYKELGKTKSVTDKMIAGGKAFIDVEAELTETAIREVVQDEEQLIITGDEAFAATQFDGLQVLIQTNTPDDNNNPLGFRTDLLDAAVETILDEYGVRPTAVYCGYAMKRAINQSLAGDVRVNLDQTNEVSTGLEIGFYQSMVGKLPIIPTFAIKKDTTTFPGSTVEDIYVVTEKAQGQDVMYLEDLYPLGKSMLDRTGAAIKFMITEATVFVLRAEEFQVRIQNVNVE